MSPYLLKTVSLTGLALLAFAGNSLLTRLALIHPYIAADQFLAIRLASGALILAFLNARQLGKIIPLRSDLPGILTLFIYGTTFTLAYQSIGAATGALILFTMVQLTLAIASIMRGQTLSLLDLGGLLVALAGLSWLLGPSTTAPPLGAAGLMAGAGIAWGFYTLHGRNNRQLPILSTTRNFLGAAFLGFLPLIFFSSPSPSLVGIGLALASGIVTSGLGYVIWYAILPNLSIPTAGAAQLLVPVITTAGGTIGLGEPFSWSFFGSASMIVGGIGLTIFSSARKARR